MAVVVISTLKQQEKNWREKTRGGAKYVSPESNHRKFNS